MLTAEGYLGLGVGDTQGERAPHDGHRDQVAGGWHPMATMPQNLETSHRHPEVQASWPPKLWDDKFPVAKATQSMTLVLEALANEDSLPLCSFLFLLGHLVNL